MRRNAIRKNDGDEHDGKDDVGLPGDGGKGDGSDHDDNEVEGPVARGGQSVGRSTNPQRHDLGRVQPGHTQPTDGEEGVEDEQEEGRHETRTGAADLVQGGPVDDGQDDHGDGHAGGAEQHELTTTKLLDGEHGDPRGGKVFGAVGGGQDARHVGRHADLVLVDVGGVVGDEIDAGNLLEDLVDVGKHDAVEVSVLGHGEQIPEAALGHLGHDVLDGHELVLDEGIVGRQAGEGAEHVQGLFFVALEDQPAGGLGQLHDQGDDDEGEEDLEGDGEAPGDAAGFGVVEAKVDPVGDADTARDERALDHDQHATTMGLGAFRLPGGHGGGVEAVAEAGDEAGDDEHGQGDGGGHEGGADDHDGGTEEDGAAAAEAIAHPDGADGAEEATDVVGGHGDTLGGGPLVLGRGRGDVRLGHAGLGGINFREGGNEGRERQEA